MAVEDRKATLRLSLKQLEQIAYCLKFASDNWLMTGEALNDKASPLYKAYHLNYNMAKHYHQQIIEFANDLMDRGEQLKKEPE